MQQVPTQRESCCCLVQGQGTYQGRGEGGLPHSSSPSLPSTKASLQAHRARA